MENQNEFNIKVPKNSTVQEQILNRKKEPEQITYHSLVLEEGISEIDFQKLQSIFQEKLRKYNREKNIENFVPRGRVTVGHTKGEHGSYTHDGKIFISTGLLDDFSEENIESDPRKVELLTLNTICHEETHALSHTNHSVYEDEEQFHYEYISGLSKIEIIGMKEKLTDFILAKLKTNKSTEFLNEAITEKFSRKVFFEYLDDNDKYTQEEKEWVLELKKSYGHNVNFFDFLCMIIGLYTENSTEVIEEAFYCSYFQDEDFFSNEMTTAFDNQLSPGFSKVLQMDKEDAVKYMNKILDKMEANSMRQ